MSDATAYSDEQIEALVTRLRVNSLGPWASERIEAADALASLQRRNAELRDAYECNTVIMHARTKKMNEYFAENASLRKAKREVLELAYGAWLTTIEHEDPNGSPVGATYYDEEVEVVAAADIRAAYATSQPQENTPE